MFSVRAIHGGASGAKEMRGCDVIVCKARPTYRTFITAAWLTALPTERSKENALS